MDFDEKALQTDVMIRLTVIEKLLIDKGILTREELSSGSKELYEKLINILNKNAISNN